MNRRNVRFLALGVSSLLVVGVFAGREMASWRPEKLAPLPSYKLGELTELSVSDRAVAFVTDESVRPYATTGALLDIRSGKLQTFRFPKDSFGLSGAIGAQGDFFWSENSSPFSLQTVDGKNQKKTFRYSDPLSASTNKNLRILPQQNRVVVLDGLNLIQWNFRNGKVTSEAGIQAFSGGGDISGDFALSRNGNAFIHCDKKRILVGDTSTGETTKTTPLLGVTFHEGAILSPYGCYAFYDQGGAPFRWEVVSTQTGKRLWGFNIPPIVSPLWAVSDDETTIVVPADKEWQVRNLQTGALLRRLPLVEGVTVASLSPDGATLYFVVNGILYRQRAR